MTGGWRIGITFMAANLTRSAFMQLSNDAIHSRSNIERLQSSINQLRVIGTAALAAFGVAAVSVFVKSAEAAGKFQEQLILLQQVTGATNAQMIGIDNDITAQVVGKNAHNFSVTTEAGIVNAMRSRGYSLPQIHNLLGTVSDTAEAMYYQSGKTMQPAQATSNLWGSLRPWGYGAPGTEQATAKAADDTVKAMGVAHLTPANMVTIDALVGSIARSAGFKYEDYLGLVVALSQSNIPASKIGTGLRNFILGMGPKGDLAHGPQSHDAALMRLNFLGHTNTARARELFQDYNRDRVAHGLPGVDYQHMSAKRQEALAEQYFGMSMGNTFKGGKMSSEQIANTLHADYLAAERKGPEALALFRADIAKSFQKWAAGTVMQIAMQGPADLHRVHQQINQQMNSHDRAAQFRSMDLPAMQQMVGNAINTIMVKLGGAHGVTPIAGSPLDLMMRGTRFVLDVLGGITDLMVKFPQATAWLGTFIGVAGLGGLAISGAIALSAVIALGEQFVVTAAEAGLSRKMLLANILGFGPKLGGAVPAAEGFAQRKFLADLGGATVGGAEGGAVMTATSRLGLLGRAIGSVGIAALRVVGFLTSWPVALAIAIASLAVIWWQLPYKFGYVLGFMVGTLETWGIRIQEFWEGLFWGLLHIMTSIFSHIPQIMAGKYHFSDAYKDSGFADFIAGIVKKTQQTGSGVSQGYRDAIPLDINLKINGNEVWKSLMGSSRQAALNSHSASVRVPAGYIMGGQTYGGN